MLPSHPNSRTSVHQSQHPTHSHTPERAYPGNKDDESADARSQSRAFHGLLSTIHARRGTGRSSVHHIDVREGGAVEQELGNGAGAGQESMTFMFRYIFVPKQKKIIRVPKITASTIPNCMYTMMVNERVNIKFPTANKVIAHVGSRCQV